MNFKKPKELVVQEAQMAALSRISYNLQQINGGNISMAGNVMTQAITDAIGEAVRSLVNNIYTDEEFEGDMGLIGDKDEFK